MVEEENKTESDSLKESISYNVDNIKKDSKKLIVIGEAVNGSMFYYTNGSFIDVFGLIETFRLDLELDYVTALNEKNNKEKTNGNPDKENS